MTLTITKRIAEKTENRKKIVEARLERERLMDLKEIKQKMWRKWRQNKGGK